MNKINHLKATCNLRQLFYCLAAFVTLAFFGCKEKAKPNENTEKKFDSIIVPGERVGLITRDVCSKEAVLAAYGDSAKVDSIYLAEGYMDEGVVLFPNNPRRTAYIYWGPGGNSKRPEFIRILSGDMPGPGADWKTDGGLAIGSTLEEVEKQNGGPFEISGFGWDYGGTVMNWKGGKFAGKGFGIVFMPSGDMTDTTLLGEHNILSTDSLLRKSEPRIATFQLGILAKEQLPACVAEKAKALSAKATNFTIHKMNVQGQDHFWVSDGAAAYDGIEYIYDANCKEVCQMGGFRMPLECSKVYDSGQWEIVWEEW